MCTNESVVEESTDGYKPVDSVLLRIMKHQNNCTCHVILQNSVTNYTIYFSKYNELSGSAPAQQNCGLAVDVKYVDTSDTTRSLQSINCAIGTGVRAIDLGGNELKFRSRIIPGDFTRGYCMQIFRNESINDCKMNDHLNKSGTDDDWIVTFGKQHTSLDECKQYCLQTKICVAVHYDSNYCFVYNRMTNTSHKDHSTYSQKDCGVDTKLQIKCYSPDPTNQASRGPTTEDNLSTTTETVTEPISNSPLTNSSTHSTMKEKKSTKDKNSDLYVYIGAGAGGLLMLLLIVCIIVCIRKRVTQTPLKESKNDSTKQFCKEDRDSDNDYGGLKDNVLYVSSEPQPNEILENGNYNTVDLEQTRKVNQDISFDGDYSTVDGTCSIIGSYSDGSPSKSKPVIKPKPKANSSLKEDQTKRQYIYLQWTIVTMNMPLLIKEEIQMM
ncbi:unnamed protein product [Mytilus edulis]|uniref:Apple domain-containing protein n=1 Tax=Mytilus edulis TaxID=6550 RepID=A0A8S3T5L4_MYTED|nr:unnamed protein product [Mytilus edulis]